MSKNIFADIAKGFIARLDSAGSAVAVKELASYIIDQRLHLQIEDILSVISTEYSRVHGVVEADVRTAFPLTKELKDALRTRVQESTGAAKVILHEQIDDSIIGGAIISTPEMELDLSLKSKLAKLKV